MTEQEKRDLIHRACKAQKPRCFGCPFRTNRHLTEWCQHYTLEELSTEELDAIIRVFNLQRGIIRPASH